MVLSYYKKDQGVVVRTVTMVSLFVLIAYGCYALYRFVPTATYDVFTNHTTTTFWGYSLLKISFFDFDINYGMVISLVLFFILCFSCYLTILNKPKPAEFLIDTEAELKKVSWPVSQHYIGSSIAVIVAVVILTIFLFVIEYVFYQLTNLIGILPRQ